LKRFAIVAIVVLTVPLASTVAVYSATHTAAPATRERVPAPVDPVDQHSIQPVSATVPVVAASSSGSCAAGWLLMDDPVLHVRFCYPRAWGFHVDGLSTPATHLTGEQQGQLRLFSSEAFPFGSPYEPSAAMVHRKDAVEVQFIVVMPPVPDFAPECTPDSAMTISNTTALSCEDRFDIGGRGRASDEVTFSPAGSLHNLKVLMPLKSTPVSQPGEPDLTGSRLLVSIVSTSARFEAQSRMFRQLLDSIVAY
jgi:hypothetical protein